MARNQGCGHRRARTPDFGKSLNFREELKSITLEVFMNEQPSTPMLPPPSGVSEWISVWRDALTKPSDLTFARIAQSPNAKLTTALLWVFLGSLVSALLAVPVQGPLMEQILQNSGLEGQGFPPA